MHADGVRQGAVADVEAPAVGAQQGTDALRCSYASIRYLLRDPLIRIRAVRIRPATSARRAYNRARVALTP